MVSLVDYVTIAGKKRKRIAFLETPRGHNQIFIEGLGMLSDFHISFLGDIIAISPTSNYLVEVREDGQPIAKRDDFTVDIDSFPKFDPMVTDSKIWIYGGRKADGSVYP